MPKAGDRRHPKQSSHQGALLDGLLRDSFHTLPRWRSMETTAEPIPPPWVGPLDVQGHLSSAD